MSLDWDVLLDGVSVKDQIASFQIRESKGAYARELTLFAADSSFYDQFDFTVFPKLRIEVKTKNGSSWVSQGKFYIEQPVLSVDPDSMLSQGIWGRSETAKAGSPWAVKASKEWEADTTCQAIMTEMADLCGLTITFETTDYTVYGGTYAVESVYPIDVITEIASFTGDFVGCNTSGELVVKSNVFHLSAADHTITDVDISSISESIEYPEFGNRILISAAGGESSYSVELAALDNTDCLPADGVATGTVLAFVTDQDGVPANNVSVDWTSEDGITIDKAVTVTGDYLIDKEQVNADNYYKVTVAYPVSEVIGVWKSADTSHSQNLWNPYDVDCIFDGNEIIVSEPFQYCDQTLVVSYITSGCAINTVTAGNNAFDVALTASVGGVQSSLDIKLGNSCVCGSSLIAIAASNSVCLGNYTNILVAATINNEPALGYNVTLKGNSGCGEQQDWVGTLGYVNIYAELVTVFNVIPGLSQVKVSLPISDQHPAPRVYYLSSKNPNRYSSHKGQVIDLTNVYTTGVELLVYYTAAGAKSFQWNPGGSIIVEEDRELYGDGCESEITAYMANGTEAGLSTTINLSSIDCTVVTDSDPDIPEDDDDDPLPEPDPEEPDPFYPIEPFGGLDSGDIGDGYPDDSDDDGDGQFPGEGGGAVSPDTTAGDLTEGDEEGDDGSDSAEPGDTPVSSVSEGGDSGGGVITACDAYLLSKIANYDTLIGEEEKEKNRYGIDSTEGCTEGFVCSCEEICDVELFQKGNTYDYSKTIHEQAIEEYEVNSPGYYELYNQLKTDHISECTENCENYRNSFCGDCTISGPSVLSPGESAEYVCSDGTTEIITMPEDGCGTVEFTIGCCTFNIRSTDGEWVTTWGTWPWYVKICGSDDGVEIPNGTRQGYETSTSSGSQPITCNVSAPYVCGVPCGEDTCADDPNCFKFYKHVGTQQWQCSE